MRNFFVKVLKYLTKSIELGEDQRIPSQPAETTKENDSLSIETPIFLTEMEKDKKKPANTSKNKKSHELTVKPFDFRDMIEIMEYPFLSISKNRTAQFFTGAVVPFNFPGQGLPLDLPVSIFCQDLPDALMLNRYLPYLR